MARKFTKLSCARWLDHRWVSLSWDAKMMFDAICSQPDLSLCGVVQIPTAYWPSYSPDRTAEDFERYLDELERADFIVRERDGWPEVWVCSFIDDAGVLASALTAKGAARAFDAIKSGRIRRRILGSLPDALRAEFPDGFLTHDVKTLSKLLSDAAAMPTQQLDLDLSEGVSATPSDTPSDSGSDTTGPPETGDLRSESGDLIPETGAAPPTFADNSGPPALTVVEEGIFHRALELLAEADLRAAREQAQLGKGEPIRSATRFLAYRYSERRSEHASRAKELLATFDFEDNPRALADVLLGARRLDFIPRRGHA